MSPTEANAKSPSKRSSAALSNSFVAAGGAVAELSSTEQLPRIAPSRMSQIAPAGSPTSQSVKHIREAALAVRTAVKLRSIVGGEGAASIKVGNDSLHAYTLYIMLKPNPL
jgi:hypothetical protein